MFEMVYDKGLPELDWTAMAAVFVAICALVVTIMQAHLTRKHNRLSVKPLLLLISDVTATGFKLSLKNVGLGPAKIKSCYAIINEQRICLYSPKAWDEITKYLNFNFPQLPKFFCFGPEMWIDSTFERRVFEFDNSGIAPKDFLAILEKMKEIKIVIEFECIYGKKQPVFSDSMYSRE